MMILEENKKKRERDDQAGRWSGFGKLSPVGGCWRMTQLSGSTFRTDLGDLETHQQQ